MPIPLTYDRADRGQEGQVALHRVQLALVAGAHGAARAVELVARLVFERQRFLDAVLRGAAGEQRRAIEHNAKAVIFSLPAKMEFSPHRTPIQRITRTGDNSFMIMSSDGIFSNWSSNGEMKKLRKDVVISPF